MAKRIFKISLILLFPLICFFYYLVSGCDPESINLERRFEGVSLSYPLGTDELGRDLMCRIGAGVVTTVSVAGLSTAIAFFFGLLLGIFAGVFGGIFDKFVVFLIDFFLSFPSLIFVILVISVFGGSFLTVVFALSFFGWTSIARVSRVEAMRIRNTDMYLSAISLGVGKLKLFSRYIIPFVVGPTSVQASFTFASFCLAEGSLGFLGLRGEDTLSLGYLILQGTDFILTHPHLSLLPGVALACLSVWARLLGEEIVSQR